MFTKCFDNSFNIVLGVATKREKNLLFLDRSNTLEHINELPFNTSLPVVLREAGLFKSSSAARNNGWDKQIPLNWSEWIVGKNKTRLFILKQEKATPFWLRCLSLFTIGKKRVVGEI